MKKALIDNQFVRVEVLQSRRRWLLWKQYFITYQEDQVEFKTGEIITVTRGKWVNSKEVFDVN